MVSVEKISTSQTIILSLILIFSFSGFNLLNKNIHKPSLFISKQQTSYHLKEKLTPFLNFNSNRFMSAILWITTLLESDLEKYKKKDLNSWMYLRFNSITLFDPFFYESYSIGGKYLSIIKDDVKGAAQLYEKALKIFKDDIWLNMDAAFNYFFEMGNIEKAIEIYDKILNQPEVQKYFPILPSIVAKLKREQGVPLKQVFKIVEIAYQKEQQPLFKNRLKNSLYALKAEMDLNCLNTPNPPSCDQFDYFGRPYIKGKNGSFKATQKWKAFILSPKTKKKFRKKMREF